MVLSNEKDTSEAVVGLARQRWKGTDVETRIREFRKIYIEHEDLAKAGQSIDCKAFEIEDAQALNDDFVYDPTATYGAGILVIGESGAGKSTFARQLCARHPPVRTATATYLPTVYMRVPSAPTERSMGNALLEAMGHPDRGGTATVLRGRAIQLMRSCRVRRLIIDDFQDIPATRIKGVQRMGDWLRAIIDATPCVVIALGTPAALVVRDSNDQLQRRMQAIHHLLPFLSTSTDKVLFRNSIVRWAKLMASIDARLPLAEASQLSSPKLAACLLQGTNARFGHLSALLAQGIRCAVESGSERMEITHLHTAFRRTFGSAADHGNPFDPDYDGEPLIGAGQAFARVVAK